MAQLIIDTGPLVALLNRHEQHHAWTGERLQQIKPPLLTCDAVLSEVCFLLSDRPDIIQRLHSALEKQVILSDFTSTPHLYRTFELMEIYKNVPMSYADACLVCMVEQNSGAAIFTLDHHFTIYRQHRRRVIPLIAPF